MNELVVEARQLSKVYVMGGEEVRAVDDVDLEMRKGDFVSIMGPSGSGKTTLLNLVGCIDRPTSGGIRLDGQDLAGLKEVELDRLRMRKIGFVFQSFNLMPIMTALENVMFPMEMAGVPRREQVRRATELLTWVGLPKRLNHKPRELSAGENQRVGIARALANGPAILLADEPTGNLDSKTTKEISLLFRRANSEQGMTIMLITHNEAVAGVAGRLLRMRDGRIVSDS
ncbi:MAG TPA: ABC transporter ATP-binding protein [Dehalococcoidia bacterium]|nr:ABC transporter ATP-binding protein [Dehalococcoidia bacterium]